jgi:hypothetical protein
MGLAFGLFPNETNDCQLTEAANTLCLQEQSSRNLCGCWSLLHTWGREALSEAVTSPRALCSHSFTLELTASMPLYHCLSPAALTKQEKARLTIRCLPLPTPHYCGLDQDNTAPRNGRSGPKIVEQKSDSVLYCWKFEPRNMQFLVLG